MRGRLHVLCAPVKFSSLWDDFACWFVAFWVGAVKFPFVVIHPFLRFVPQYWFFLFLLLVPRKPSVPRPRPLCVWADLVAMSCSFLVLFLGGFAGLGDVLQLATSTMPLWRSWLGGFGMWQFQFAAGR